MTPATNSETVERLRRAQLTLQQDIARLEKSVQQTRSAMASSGKDAFALRRDQSILQQLLNTDTQRLKESQEQLRVLEKKILVLAPAQGKERVVQRGLRISVVGVLVVMSILVLLYVVAPAQFALTGYFVADNTTAGGIGISEEGTTAVTTPDINVSETNVSDTFIETHPEVPNEPPVPSPAGRPALERTN